MMKRRRLFTKLFLSKNNFVSRRFSYQIEGYIPQAHDSSSEQQNSKSEGQRDGKMID